MDGKAADVSKVKTEKPLYAAQRRGGHPSMGFAYVCRFYQSVAALFQGTSPY